MRTTSLSRCFVSYPFVISSVILLATGIAAAGEAKIKIDRKQGPVAPVEERKLAPELQAAKAAGAKFIGATQQGAPVVDAPADVPLANMIQRMAAVPEVEDVAAVAAEDKVDRINELIVMYEPAAAPQEKVGGLDVTQKYEPAKFVVVKSADGFDAAELTALENDPNVKYVEPNYLYRIPDAPNDEANANPAPAAVTPNDPRFGELWGMSNIHASDAWQTNHDSDMLVAVIDTGVDYNHPDLKGNMWTNSAEVAGDGMDNDNNGFVDDIHGFDFTNNDGDPLDTHSHGTHCAGTIGAVGNNERGVVGVSWKVKIMAVQMLNPSATAANIARGIRYAADNGATVLSNSWGGGAFSQTIKDAITYAGTKNALFIVAAGNNGTDNDQLPFYPASYDNDNIISVANLQPNDTLWTSSCFGATSVDLAAPGRLILSTIPGDTYAQKTGTSMACPHVSGAVALLWSTAPHKHLTPAQMKKLVMDKARRLDSLSGKCVTGATLDLAFMGDNAQPAAASQPPAAAPAAPAADAAGVDTTIQGKLQTPTVAIGGETTGAEVQVNNARYELDAKGQAQVQKAIKDNAGKEVIVKGKLTTKQGEETGERKIIEVESIKAAE